MELSRIGFQSDRGSYMTTTSSLDQPTPLREGLYPNVGLELILEHAAAFCLVSLFRATSSNFRQKSRTLMRLELIIQKLNFKFPNILCSTLRWTGVRGRAGEREAAGVGTFFGNKVLSLH